MIKNLYIIGNGFDIHHGINSSYGAYHQWMEDNGHWDAINKIDEIYGGGYDWWSDLENSLGELDMDEYSRNQASEHYPNFASDDFRDADWYDAEYAVESEFNEMTDALKETFAEWIEQLNHPDVRKKIPLVKKNALFLNFNYTATLEDFYNVPRENVWHPHGYIHSEVGDYVLGHGKDYNQLKHELLRQGPQPPQTASEDELREFFQENSDYIIDRAQDATISGVAGLQKLVNEIIASNNDFWKAIRGVTHVYILGYSFSSIDEPYLDKIMSSICKRRVKWTISYYGGRDLERIRTFMEKHHLRNSRVCVAKMIELQNKGQLVIDF